MSKLIKVKDLVFKYKQVNEGEADQPERVAVNHVSFDIDEGSFVAVAGSNGSGKSTLARCLNGLLIPTEGEIFINDMNTKDENMIWDIRRTVGMVFQNPDNQIVSSIVEDEVAFGPENIGIKHPELRSRVNEALNVVGMYELRNREVHKLSGGQKQRVAIAGAVAMRPDCIIFDEPTAMLDPMGRKQVLDVIRNLNAQGITIVLITHFMDEVAQADRALVMKDGNLISDSTPCELFMDRGLIVKAGLEVPTAVEIGHRLREHGINLPQNVLSKDDLVNALCQ